MPLLLLLVTLKEVFTPQKLQSEGHKGLRMVLVVFVVSSICGNITLAQQCGIKSDSYSIYQKMLKGHTYKTFKTWTRSFDCRDACSSDVRCQSYNFVFLRDTCELNNRTKQARPNDFVIDVERYYMERISRVSLGSIPELPADSCAEIKASEGGQAVSGIYWLDATRTGNSILARCDVKTEVADYCIKHLCFKNTSCVNQHVNYTCWCKIGWTGNYCGKDTNECTEKANTCPAQPSCVNSIGSYRCNCRSDWRDRGAHTCIDVDECLVGSHSCPSNSRCSNTPGSYRCICLAGWRNQGPSTCVDIDECSVGSHSCPSNSRCSNTIGSYLCRCKSGFTQPYSRSRCQDINECTTGSHSCSSYGNAYCVNTIGSYYCRCNRCYYMSGRSCNPDCRLDTQYYYTKSYTSYRDYYTNGCWLILRCRKYRTKWISKMVQKSRQVWVKNRVGASCPC